MHSSRARQNRAPADRLPSNVCYRARCGLCAYPINHKDKSIVLEQNGHELPKENLAFSPCRERCPHSKGQATAYHADCAQDTFRRGSPERAAAVHQLGAQVMAYAYDPPAVEIARRNKWLSDALLGCMVGGALPNEICSQIAEAALRDQAARTAVAQLPRMAEAGYTVASLALPVYTRFVWFEGVRYMASISNHALGGEDEGDDDEDDEDICIWTPKPGAQVKAVLVAEDHLGIREVRIAGSAAVPATREQPNLWWRAFAANGGSTLHGRTDGIKLRGLREFNSPAFRDRMIPSPNMRSPGSTFWLGTQTDPGQPLWTRKHTINKPGTTGYIVGLYDDNGKLQICAFQPWAPGQDFSLYTADKTTVDPDEEMFWFYFPVDRHERITDVWARQAAGSKVQSRGWLMWATSQGRCFPFALRSRTEDSYSRLAELDSTEAQDVFLGSSGGSLCEVQLQAPETAPSTSTASSPSAAGRRLRLPVHRSPHPRYAGRDECVFTSAPLHGISEVTASRGGSLEDDDGHALVTGLLLRYTDGRMATVGSVRLDRLDKPLGVGSSPGWRLVMHRERRVTGIELAPFRGGRSSAACLEGRWEGSLEWWTGLSNNCWVHHVGREDI